MTFLGSLFLAYSHPSGVAVEQRDKDVAIAGLIHAVVPCLLTAVLRFLFVYPDVVDRMAEHADGLDLLLQPNANVGKRLRFYRRERKRSLHRLEIIILILEEVAISLPHKLDKST